MEACWRERKACLVFYLFPLCIWKCCPKSTLSYGKWFEGKRKV